MTTGGWRNNIRRPEIYRWRAFRYWCSVIVRVHLIGTNQLVKHFYSRNRFGFARESGHSPSSENRAKSDISHFIFMWGGIVSTRRWDPDRRKRQCCVQNFAENICSNSQRNWICATHTQSANNRNCVGLTVSQPVNLWKGKKKKQIRRVGTTDKCVSN